MFGLHLYKKRQSLHRIGQADGAFVAPFLHQGQKLFKQALGMRTHLVVYPMDACEPQAPECACELVPGGPVGQWLFPAESKPETSVLGAQFVNGPEVHPRQSFGFCIRPP